MNSSKLTAVRNHWLGVGLVVFSSWIVSSVQYDDDCIIKGVEEGKEYVMISGVFSHV